jgi:TetR/AcrR family tetracycline transcriptional repressor
MAEAIFREHFHTLRARSASEPWEKWLLKTTARLRKAMLAHKDGARVIVGAHLFPAVTLAVFFETCLQSLISAGLSLAAAHEVVVTVVHFTFGRAIEEQSGPTPAQMRDLMRAKATGPASFATQFPLLLQANKANNVSERHAAADFERCVKLIIRGASSSPTRRRRTQ